MDAARLARAVHLDAEPLAGGTWRVSGGAVPHQVTADGERLACDCRDAAVRGGPCKHRLAVALLSLDGHVLAALRELVPKRARRKAAR